MKKILEKVKVKARPAVEKRRKFSTEGSYDFAGHKAQPARTIKRVVRGKRMTPRDGKWHWKGYVDYMLDTIEVQGTSDDQNRYPEVWEEV